MSASTACVPTADKWRQQNTPKNGTIGVTFKCDAAGMGNDSALIFQVVANPTKMADFRRMRPALFDKILLLTSKSLCGRKLSQRFTYCQ